MLDMVLNKNETIQKNRKNKKIKQKTKKNNKIKHKMKNMKNKIGKNKKKTLKKYNPPTKNEEQ